MTLTGDRSPLSAKDLSSGVNIPESLAGDVLEAAPQPPHKSPYLLSTRQQGSGISCRLNMVEGTQGVLELSGKIMSLKLIPELSKYHGDVYDGNITPR